MSHVGKFHFITRAVGKGKAKHDQRECLGRLLWLHDRLETRLENVDWRLWTAGRQLTDTAGGTRRRVDSTLK